MRSFRRPRLFACLLLLAITVIPAGARAAEGPWPMRVTDALGREVLIERQPRRLLLASGFNLVALSLLHPDPPAVMAGWNNDLIRLAPAMAAQFRRRFPALDALPLVGGADGQSMSLEAIVASGADLVLLAGWQGLAEPGQRLMEQLAAAGIPSLVLDFNREPLARTAPGMRLLGRVLGREAQGEAFAAFYEQRLAHIRGRLAAAGGQGPSLLMQAFPGYGDCCWVFGPTGLGALAEAAGARNLGAGLFPGSAGGRLNAEYVLVADPTLYVATGIDRAGTMRLGPGTSLAEARAGLARLAAEPPLAALPALAAGRAHAIWNYFNATPLNLLALEALARWSRPDLFADLDPGATLAEINARFAAVPFTGSYWVSLDPAADGTPPPAP